MVNDDQAVQVNIGYISCTILVHLDNLWATSVNHKHQNINQYIYLVISGIGKTLSREWLKRQDSAHENWKIFGGGTRAYAIFFFKDTEINYACFSVWIQFNIWISKTLIQEKKSFSSVVFETARFGARKNLDFWWREKMKDLGDGPGQIPFFLRY